jgi:hypothetical protein
MPANAVIQRGGGALKCKAIWILIFAGRTAEKERRLIGDELTTAVSRVLISLVHLLPGRMP